MSHETISSTVFLIAGVGLNAGRLRPRADFVIDRFWRSSAADPKFLQREEIL
jgi:hypothetical protein